MTQELTRLEKAAVDLSTLLRWGLAPSDAPLHQQCEWPYTISAEGDAETKKLIETLQEIDDALDERGLKK